MTTLVLTAYDNAMAPIGDLTSPLMLAYANRHGFNFACVRTIEEGQHYWQKIWSCTYFLKVQSIDRILWLDADQVITNPDFVPPWETGFQASFDWGSDAVDESMFSACGFVIGQDMLPLVEAVGKRYEQFKDAPFPEQSALRHLYKCGHDYRFRMRTHHRRQFNAVPVEISADAPEPWQKGDFCAHLTHLPVLERVRVFHIIQDQIA